MEQLTLTLSLVISALGLIWIMRLWRRYWVDDLRNDLFRLRSEIFLYANDHALLDSVAHRELRRRVNSFIRYAHRVSFARTVLTIVAAKLMDDNGEYTKVTPFESYLEGLSSEQRQRFVEWHDCTIQIVFIHVIRTSMTLRMAAFVSRILHWVYGEGHVRVPRSVSRRFPADQLEQEAMSFENTSMAA
jgi:hypothetical protein